jgi:hypothetical protein
MVTVVPAPQRWSMSLIRSMGECMRSAQLQRECDITGQAAHVGRLFHEIAAKVGAETVAAGRDAVDPRFAEQTAKDILAHPDEHGPLPKDAYLDVLDLVGRWARMADLQPGTRFEVSSRQELRNWTLSARLDTILLDAAGTCWVTDWKTGWAPPPPGLPVQGEIYAWHGFRLHPDAERVVYEEIYVRSGRSCGPVTINPADLDGTEAWLETSLTAFEDALGHGPLPATPGSWCAHCPSPDRCPLPAWARPASEVRSEDDAAAQLEALLVEEARVKARKAAIRAWLEATGQRVVSVGGEEIGWNRETGSRLDTEALTGVVDLDEYRTTTAPTFGRRKHREEDACQTR